ncbi:MAG: FMN-binding protein [Chitinivibrionales bacterium]
MSEEIKNSEIFRMIITIVVIASVAGLGLSLVNANTEDRIAKQKIKKQKKKLSAVVPASMKSVKKEGEDKLPDTYWVLKTGDMVTGFVFLDSAKGYSSWIKLLVAVDPEGSIIGVSLLSQQETPGLGTRVEERLSEKTFWNGFTSLFSQSESSVSPWFMNQFEDLSVKNDIMIKKGSEWHTLSPEEKDAFRNENAVSAITGATISTKAVTDAISKHIPEYLAELKRKYPSSERYSDEFQDESSDTLDNNPDSSSSEKAGTL